MNGISCGLVAVAIAIGLFQSTATAEEQEPCADHDRYDRIMAGARAEWPDSNPIRLSEEWTRWFMLGYNDDLDAAEDTPADTVVAFPLPPDISATSFFFGFSDGCLTFYVDLSEAKAMHLVEAGHALAGTGETSAD